MQGKKAYTPAEQAYHRNSKWYMTGIAVLSAAYGLYTLAYTDEQFERIHEQIEALKEKVRARARVAVEVRGLVLGIVTPGADARCPLVRLCTRRARTGLEPACCWRGRCAHRQLR